MMPVILVFRSSRLFAILGFASKLVDELDGEKGSAKPGKSKPEIMKGGKTSSGPVLLKPNQNQGKAGQTRQRKYEEGIE